VVARELPMMIGVTVTILALGGYSLSRLHRHLIAG
jgi:hypothetical protein